MYVEKKDGDGKHRNYMRAGSDNRKEDIAVSIYYAYVKGQRVYTTKPDVYFWDSLKKASE